MCVCVCIYIYIYMCVCVRARARARACARVCVSAYVQVETRDEFGNTLLILAAQTGSKRMCKILLRHGASLSAQNWRCVYVCVYLCVCVCVCVCACVHT